MGPVSRSDRAGGVQSRAKRPADGVAARKSPGALRRLLRLGADRAARMPDGSDALAVATTWGRSDIAKLLA